LEGLDRLKQATRWMWSLGDYGAVAKLLEPYARRLADACGIAPGMEVLDVAAGNGNFAVAAVELGGRVTASDYSPRMLELGRARTEGAGIEWVGADVEALPFPDGRFDVTASVFGAMFAPRPDLAAREMFRVCRPGGLVAMANYGWAGFLGDYAKLLARYSNPAPAALPQPFEWGDPAVVRKRLQGLAKTIEIRDGTLTFASGFGFWELTNGPTIALRQIVPPDRYAAFRREAEALMDAPELTSSYITVLARKRA
jgi:SAM-dependent methyltransferase